MKKKNRKKNTASSKANSAQNYHLELSNLYLTGGFIITDTTN